MVVLPLYVVFRKPSEKDNDRLVSSPAIQANNVKERLTNGELHSVERQFLGAIRCEGSIESL
jgi:hypothetical protein